jgi:uncharacterized SAM-binding protein YcdF (DUF218 family)
VGGIALISWIQWGGWPDPVAAEAAWEPDTIVVLGGGNQRGASAYRLHQKYPEVPVLVTGDGGEIMADLLLRGVPGALLIHEVEATSTYENATCTAPLLDAREAQRIILVTDWYHVPRSLATFRHVQPGREIAAEFAPRPEVLQESEIGGQRRERLAALAYWLRFGINSFRP